MVLQFRRLLLLLVFIEIVTELTGQNPGKVYIATRTSDPPKIDGVLKDEAWKNIEPITEMTQRQPVEGIKASQKQEIRLIYDDNAIYVGVMFYDPKPDSIYHEIGSRDNSSLIADQFYIGFDTYNTYDAYVFGVSASGVQYDYRDSDLTYNAVWESEVSINEMGWAIEMRIPYSAIRFPSKAEQEWGFQLIRTITHNQEYDQWVLTPRNVENSRIMWGKLKGLSNISAPVRLSMTPFVIAGFENAPFYANNGTVRYTNSTAYNFGADIKYGIDEKFTVDMTLLPDFSQTNSDNLVKNLSYMEVTYDENRSFFNEGTELFNKNSLFYSRRIGKTPSAYYTVEGQLKEGEIIRENPSRTKLLNAIKLSGRNNNGLGIGIFNAVTDNMYAVVEDIHGNKRKILTEPLTNYNMIVFDQRLKNNSSIYIINTNTIRSKKGNDANITGFGTTLQNKKNSFATDWDFAVSQKYFKTDTLKDSFTNQLGYRYFAGIRKISGDLQFGYSHQYISSTYDSRDMGYYVIGNKMKERIYIDYNTFKPGKYSREYYNSLYFDYHTNPETHKVGYNLAGLSMYRLLNSYHSISIGGVFVPCIGYNYDEPRVPGRYSRMFKYYMVSGDFQSDERKKLALTFHIEYGDFSERYTGWAIGIAPAVRYRFSDKLQAKFTFNYYDDTYNIGFVNIDENSNIIYGGRELITYINTLSLQYLFKNDMSLTLNSRHYWNTGEYSKYFTLRDDGEIIENAEYQGNHNFNYNAFYIDALFSWQFAPGSNLTLSYKNLIEHEGQGIIHNYTRNLNQVMDSPQTNSVSVKLLYYLDYQYIKKAGKRH